MKRPTKGPDFDFLDVSRAHFQRAADALGLEGWRARQLVTPVREVKVELTGVERVARATQLRG